MSDIIYIVVSILFVAFFSGMEVAYGSANKIGLELEKNKGTFTSNLLSIFSSKSEHFIATMLVGYTFSLVVYGLLLTHVLQPYLSQHISSNIVLLATQIIIAALILLITVEFIPKTIFKINANRFLNIFSVPVLLFYVLFFPVAYLFSIVSKGIIEILFRKKISNETDKNVFTIVDLDHFVNDTYKTGEETENEEETEIELFKNALDFSKAKVRDCMVPRTYLEAIDISSTIDELKDKFIETGFSKILIYSENIDNIIGYVHSSQMFRNPSKIKPILNPVSFVPETMMASTLLSMFTQKHKSIAIVVDEFGGTSGMITTEDVLEEIFGEIEDEHDTDDLVVKNVRENEWILAARHEISLLNTKYHFNLPESDDYDTIAGLILNHHEDIPKINTVIPVGNFEFRILNATETRIELVLMKIIDTN